MESFLVALGVVFPMLVMMSVGVLIRRQGLVDGPAVRKMDGLTFRIFLPCLLFTNIYHSDMTQDFRPGMVAFALVGFGLSLAAVLVVVPRLEKERGRISVICQAIVRGNSVIFGVSVAEHIYGEGNVGAAALLMAIIVPVMNVTAVLLLEAFRPGGAGHVGLRRLVLGVIKNPLIIASVTAFVLALTGVRLPAMVEDAVTGMARAATPLAFIMLGATLSLDGFQRNGRCLFWTVLVRMVIAPAILLPAAVLLGFRGVELVALMALFASPTAVSSFTMAQQMGADGELAAQLVALTSVVSLPTIFSITFLLQQFALL